MAGCSWKGTQPSSSPPTPHYRNYLTVIQEGEATRVLCKYHANGGDEHHPLVVFEMAQIRHAVRMEKETGTATTWASLVATPGNRKRMMIVVALAVFSQWRYVCRPWNPTPHCVCAIAGDTKANWIHSL